MGFYSKCQWDTEGKLWEDSENLKLPTKESPYQMVHGWALKEELALLHLPLLRLAHKKGREKHTENHLWSEQFWYQSQIKTQQKREMGNQFSLWAWVEINFLNERR